MAVLSKLSPVGGGTGSATFTPSAGAYGAGDIIEGAKLISGLGPRSGGTIIITSSRFQISASALQSGEAGYTLQLYSVTPPSALADNAPWDVPSGDRAPIYVGPLTLGSPLDVGSTLFISRTGTLATLTVPPSGQIYAYLQTIGAFTATATARLVELDWVAA